MDRTQEFYGLAEVEYKQNSTAPSDFILKATENVSHLAFLRAVYPQYIFETMSRE